MFLEPPIVNTLMLSMTVSVQVQTSPFEPLNMDNKVDLTSCRGLWSHCAFKVAVLGAALGKGVNRQHESSGRCGSPQAHSIDRHLTQLTRMKWKLI